MTGPARGGTERGTRTPSRSTGIPRAAGAIALVLAFGLALRFIIAYVLLPGSGFGTDIVSFQAWAGMLAADGPGGFYERGWVDYTPGYMYVLWLIGVVGQAIGGIGDLVKLPAILSDAVVGYLVWSMTRELGAGRRAALLAGGIFVLNPVSWFDSAVWGQVDSFGLIFLLLGLREVWRDRPERAAILTMAAAVIKPQLGILIPLLAFVTIRRALWPAGGYGDDPPPDPVEPRPGLLGRYLAWERRTGHPVRIVTTGIAGFVTAVLLCFPFGLSVVEPTAEAPYVRSGLLEQVGLAAGGYPYVTVNAYNPWALVPGDTGLTLAEHGLWMCDTADVPPSDDGGDRCSSGTAFIGPVPAVFVGSALLLVTIAVAIGYAVRHPDRRTLLLALTVLAIAFFVVPTRVHERYMFPFFGLAAILAAVAPRWRIAYVLLSVATFANMYVVLTTIYDNSERGVVDWLGIGPDIRGQLGVAVVAMIHLVGFVWAFTQLRGDGRERLADEIAEAGTPVEPVPPAGTARAPTGSPEAGVLGAEVAWDRPRAWAGNAWPGWLSWVRWPLWLEERFGQRPVRPDRTATLAREGGGRFDKLDVWLLVVLVIATLTLRTFRLGEPLGMHFDEVYHARTATEFLQHWRYGESHDIYEWTHPHLGKYAMAAGIVAFGEDRVKATSSIGEDVHDALLEPAHDDFLEQADDEVIEGGQIGARLWLATGTGLLAYDLASREEVVRAELDGARRLALDTSLNALIVGTESGEIRNVDLNQVDAAGRVDVLDSFVVGTVDGPVDRLLVTDDGLTILAASGDLLHFLDPATGESVVTAEVAGLADFDEASTSSVLVATPAAIEDPAAVAARIAELLGGDAAAYETTLTATDEAVVVAPLGDETEREAVDAALTAGELPGIAVEDRELIAVAGAEGVAFIDRATGETVTTLGIEGGAHGMTYVSNIDEPRFYVSTGTVEEPGYAVVLLGGADGGPSVQGEHPLPGLGSRVAYDEPTRQVHILGQTPDGSGSTVYVIEPHANAVYADARLPFEPVAWALDVSDGRPASDRQELLAFGADGSAASVDIGQHAFAWRIPGVLAGALMAGLLYVLARILFRRREVAVLAGCFALVEGMLFAQSRIAMNDAYVGLFIMAAYTVFAALWTAAWRGRWAFWLGFPMIGVLLGLALASKWVAAYAIGALVLLLLARSALGRVLLIVGMIGLTSVLGYLALSTPTGEGFGNVTFLLIMIALTLVAVIATVLHPIAWSDDEYRFAVLAPAGLGALLFFAALTVGRLQAPVAVAGLEVSPLEVAILLALVSPLVYLAFRIAAGYGFGPLAAAPAPDDPLRMLEPPAPPATSWLRPGWALGIPVAWAAVCLVVIPLAVYVVSYIPWAWIENHQIVEGWPAGHTGQTLIDLTRGMYDYHNQLTSAHAASSPWWAWPFDLKPVWFYQGGFGDGTAAAIYDSGNLVVWWLGVPAMAFVAWQAFRRRSLPLALIAIGFAAQWISWARIDRAAFQYHYYTALPFVVLAVAYFIAELWHGASRRTWLLAKAAAALAIMAPALMHLFSRPLCGYVNVTAVNPGSRACPAVIPDLVLTWRTAGLALVIGLSVLAFLLVMSGRLSVARGPWRSGPPWLELALVGGFTALGLVLVAGVGDTPLFASGGIWVEPIAALVAVPLGYLAMQVLGARDARRFVGGIVIAAAVVFLVFYPNISALPLPSTMVNAYQGILPTYLYDFQFPVNTVPRNVETSFATPLMGALVAGLVFISFVVAYSAWTWRLALAERDLGATDDDSHEARASTPV